MLHRIDGELMAVGVLDYTHEALSSVYLFYDPKYEFLTPGTLSALLEIEYIQKIQREFDDRFKFYYMGLYFQDCQKSVYKANFKPSQVACPYTSNYVYLTDAVKQMITDEKKPHLYEKVRGHDKSQIDGAMKDALMIPPSDYVRLADEQALKLVNMSFRIIYDDKFVIGIEHLQEQF